MKKFFMSIRRQCVYIRRFLYFLVSIVILYAIMKAAANLDTNMSFASAMDATMPTVVEHSAQTGTTSPSDAPIPADELDYNTGIAINIILDPTWEFDSVGGFSNGFAKVTKDGKTGYVDNTGKIVIPLEYDWIDEIKNGYAKVGMGEDKNIKYGLVDINGEVVIPLIYDGIHYNERQEPKWVTKYDGLGPYDMITGYDGMSFESVSYYELEGLVLVENDGKVGYIDMTGNIIIPVEYDEAYVYSNGLLRMENKMSTTNGIEYSLFSLFDSKGNVVLPVAYLSIDDFFDGLAITYQWKGKYGVVSEAGEVVSLPEYDIVYDFSDGLATVGKNSKYGKIDKTGKLIVPLEYDDISRSVHEVTVVGIHIEGTHQYGVIDKDGHVVIPIEYSYIDVHSDDTLARVKKNGKYGFINYRTGKIILPVEYEELGDFYEGLAYVCEPSSVDGAGGGRYGYIDKTGTFIVKPEYDYAYNFSNGLAIVKKNGKYGLIDKTGKVVVPVKFTDIDHISDELAKVRYSYYYGLINITTGAYVIPPEYDSLSFSYYDRLIKAEKNKKYGYIDINGNVVVPTIYDDIYSFSNGFAKVEVDRKQGYVDLVGNVVVPTIYDYIDEFVNGYVKFKDGPIFKDGGKFGCIDMAGNVVLPAIYDYVGNFYNGVALIKNDNKYGYVDTAGNVVAPPIYYRADVFYGRFARVTKEDWQTFIMDNFGAIMADYEDFKYWSSDSDWAWVKTNGMWGLIDDSDIYVIPPKYDAIDVFRYNNKKSPYGMIFICKDEK